MEIANGTRRASLTDYASLRGALERHGQLSGEIGTLNGIKYEGWVIGAHGLIVAMAPNGKIGIYAFVGKDGAPVGRDIEYVEQLAKCGCCHSQGR